ncbi:hypothetical protein M409DRAFT_25825 [Zasmidium cellare ATCC 36951]|uniref:Uncharacterized protein n=1 Tax=Zasmidium cellare ATCC 36951 TaxID=1080233 RepID=A0A6A6C8X3_ZASCE|nr:uncharacterized protein M409DRAFT_25825 [Zasmidium cellare ATCC 36951]KAF2163637.1 hypothetical protein M409DRAFT_25825 [Zasmidium cellare ATCC 36951]
MGLIPKDIKKALFNTNEQGKPSGNGPAAPVDSGSQTSYVRNSQSQGPAQSPEQPGTMPSRPSSTKYPGPPTDNSGNSRQRQDPRDLALLLHEKEQETTVLRNQLAQLRRENDGLGQEIRSLQAKSFKSFGDSRWVPLDSSTLNGALEWIRSDLTGLVKTYAADDLSKIERLPSDAKSLLQEDLSKVIRFNSASPNGIQELWSITNASRLCLTALLSRALHGRILSDPFFFMDDTLDEELVEVLRQYPDLKQRQNPCEVLYGIFRAGKKYDQEKAQQWRSDTVRLMNPYQTSDNADGNAQLIYINEKIDDVCRKVPKAMDQSLIGLFLRQTEAPERKKFMDGLEQIFVDTGRLAVQIWAQRPSLECRSLSKLAEERFHVRSPLLEPHPLHRRDDPEDPRLNGWLPKVVVHPAIVARGTHDADHYERTNVLSKAVVWLELKDGRS